MLSSLIAEAEEKNSGLKARYEDAQRKCEESQTVLAALTAQYDELIRWSDLYHTADIAAKKMIVNALINKVEVRRDYKVHLDFNIDIEQFMGNYPEEQKVA